MSTYASDSHVRRLRDGSAIFNEGDAPDGMYVVLSGKVKIVRHKGGHEITLKILNQGDSFGEMSLLDHKPRSAGAKAVGDVELRYISASEFEQLSLSDPFVKQMLLTMSQRLREVDDALTKLDAENVARHAYLEDLSLHREWLV